MGIIRSMLGLHKWRHTHRSGAERECKVCGAKESQYMLWVDPPMDPWWETTDEGDKNKEPCGGKRFKPSRFI